MKVTQISIGRFHHFHLARQLERSNMLETIWTGYPKFKLTDEEGIAKEKIKTYPWLHAPYMFRGSLNLDKWDWLNKEWAWQAQQTLDVHVAALIDHPTIVVALSSSGLHSGTSAQRLGGYYICDRGSSHIRFQDQILTDEYKRFGFKFKGVDTRIIHKEELEYEQADLITVPSEFVRRSFIKMGVPAEKIKKVIYGARLERFTKISHPPLNLFKILWVGSVSIRKGFFYLYEAFTAFKHPNKQLNIVGDVSEEVKKILSSKNLDGINFLGKVANKDLPLLYSESHVFILPSIEEGLAMVQGEALACGCPVISTINSGAEDLFTDGLEGFVVPIRSSKAILQSLQNLADDENIRNKMSEAAVKKVTLMGGWDTYGNEFVNLLNTLNKKN